jgi:hypothetical protein
MSRRNWRVPIASAAIALAAVLPALSQEPCSVQQPTASFSIRHVKGNPALNLAPNSPVWKHAAFQSMYKDCSRQIDYPHLKSEIRAFWTDTDLYLLFRCPYTVLNLFLPASNNGPRVGLWDRDVVEMFLGDDWTNIRHYREYEIAPTGGQAGIRWRASTRRIRSGMRRRVFRSRRSAQSPCRTAQNGE